MVSQKLKYDLMALRNLVSLRSLSSLLEIVSSRLAICISHRHKRAEVWLNKMHKAHKSLNECSGNQQRANFLANSNDSQVYSPRVWESPKYIKILGNEPWNHKAETTSIIYQLID